MAKVFYKKELLNNAYIVAGAPVPFEALADNRGVIALDPESSGPLVAALTEAAKAQRGGVVSITEDEYNDLKKNHPFNRSALKPSETLKAMPPLSMFPGQKPKGAAPAATSPPPAAPTSLPVQSAPQSTAAPNPPGPTTPAPFIPATGRVGKIRAAAKEKAGAPD